MDASISYVPPIAQAREGFRLANKQIVQVLFAMLAAPLLVFALGLAPLACISIIGGLFLTTFLVGFRLPAGDFLSAPVDLRTLAVCLGAGGVLCVIAGEGHFLYAQFDWHVRDAVLADLVRAGFPAFYVVEGVDYFLRAPLGMYLLPALVGRVAGLPAAHFALLAQNASIVGALLYLSVAFTSANKLQFLAVLLLTGPLDCIPVAFFNYKKTGAPALSTAPGRSGPGCRA